MALRTVSERAEFEALSAATANWAKSRNRALRLESHIDEARRLLRYFVDSNRYDRDVTEAYEILRQALEISA